MKNSVTYRITENYSCELVCPEALSGARKLETQHDPVDAPALPGWGRTVLEHMAHMQAARGAMTLGAGIDQLEVGLGLDRAFADRLPVARSARAAVKLVL